MGGGVYGLQTAPSKDKTARSEKLCETLLNKVSKQVTVDSSKRLTASSMEANKAYRQCQTKTAKRLWQAVEMRVRSF